MNKGEQKKTKPKKTKPSEPKHQNGKGDSPRNVSNKFKKNYDNIDWDKNKKS